MSNYIPERDLDGRTITRLAAANAGWSYQYREFEIEISKLNGLKSYKENNTLQTDCTIKIYDTNGAEITAQENETNAVRTRVRWSPSSNIEIVGGTLNQIAAPSFDLRLSVNGGAVQLGTGYYKSFISSLNLKFRNPANRVETDGRVTKHLNLSTAGVPVPTNEFDINLYYAAGSVHSLVVAFEVFLP